jgi:hypothetical protein
MSASDRHGSPARNGHNPNGNGPNPRPTGASRRAMRLASTIDADAEMIVRGEAPPDAGPELAELADLARELRSACATPPPREVAGRHIAAIVAEAASLSKGSAVAVGRGRRRLAMRLPLANRSRARAFRLAAAGLATLLAVTGLAVAGVKPPATLDGVLERIGIGATEETTPPAGGGRGAADASARGEVPDRVAQRAERSRVGERTRGDRPAAQREPGATTSGDERRSTTGNTESKPGRAIASQARGDSRTPKSPDRNGDHPPGGTGQSATPGSLGGKGGTRPEADRGSGGPGGAGQQRGPGRGVVEEMLGNVGPGR